MLDQPEKEEAQTTATGDEGARQALIDGILSLAKEKYDEAHGKAQRAQIRQKKAKR